MNINAPRRNLAVPFVKARALDDETPERRLPFIHKIPDAARNHFIAMCGEYVGTVLFLFFALSGTQTANSVKSSAGLTITETGANPQQLQYIALSFGFSLAINAWVFFRISGGLFNPAVTVGMCLVGALPWFRGFLLIIVQILGGITAAAIVSCLFPGPLNCSTTLGGGTSVVQGVFIEMFLTAQLVFTIFMLAAEKHKGTFIAPIGIGLSLFVAELTGVYFTGGSLNPARSLGPAVVERSFFHYHWIYWVGPLLGSIVAAGFYLFIKALEYETANPNQDAGAHHSKVQKRKDLLIAAGINEVDATHVANELTPQTILVVEGGGANGTGPTQRHDTNQGEIEAADGSGMYGTQYRSGGSQNDVRPAGQVYGDKDGTNSPTYSTASRPGDHRYLARRGSQAPSTSNQQRHESPAMATNEDIYSPLVTGGNHETLGHGVAEPKTIRS